MTDTPRKIAIVLMNLGGPDGPQSVRPFLFNLFNDRNIIGAPNPIRFFLAWLISKRRTPEATAIYEEMGGGSPLVPNTEAQARALEAALADLGEVRAFLAMRYWHPMTDEAARQVKDFAPDEVILLPLYPQYATATTRSSLEAWRTWAVREGLSLNTRALCCYPADATFAKAHAKTIRDALVALAAETGAAGKRIRVLYSAHGLPERTVAQGDPYQWQVEQTVAAVEAELAALDSDTGHEAVTCYQSRVGPLKWIQPYTEDEIVRAGRDGVPLLVVPIAFVSDHSETLVELGIEYRELAEDNGVPAYGVVPALGTEPLFIAALAAQVRRLRRFEQALVGPGRGGAPICRGHALCPHFPKGALRGPDWPVAPAAG